MFAQPKGTGSALRVVSKVPEEALSYTNLVYVDEKLHKSLEFHRNSAFVTIKGYIFCAKSHPKASTREIFIGGCIRTLLKVQLGETITISPLSPELLTSITAADILIFSVSLFTKSSSKILCTTQELEAQCKTLLNGHILHLSQTIPFKIHDQQIKLTVIGITSTRNDEKSYVLKALVTNGTEFNFDDLNSNVGIFKTNFCFEELGIGGLDSEFDTIFRRAFISRTYPLPILRQLGISHVKGLILYGPPGTGKTLIARQISKALNCSKPKVTQTLSDRLSMAQRL